MVLNARRPPIRFAYSLDAPGPVNGAWWPQADQHLSGELAALVSELETRMGRIISINLNWESRSPRSPMTRLVPLGPMNHWIASFSSATDRASLLVIPAVTRSDMAGTIFRICTAIPTGMSVASAQADYQAASRILSEANRKCSLDLKMASDDELV